MSTRNLKFLISISLVASPTLLYCASNVKVEGSDRKVIEISPEASTGLNSIYVVFNTEGCRMSATTTNGYTATVYRYSNLGGGYAEEIKDVDRSAASITFPLPAEDMGYIIEEGTDRYYFWVVNYARHAMTIESVSPAPDQDCSYSVIDIDGYAEAITYYTINGQPRVLGREIYVDFTTQEFNQQFFDFSTVDVRKTYESLGKVLSISPPAYCSTYFTISGDRFLREWGMEIVAETGLVEPVAVDCRTDAIQQESSDEDDASNVMNGDSSGLGGSAPADISFLSVTTEGVLHYEWQLSTDQNFENPDYRFYQKDLDYTFLDEGTYYLRFIASNSDGTCEAFGDVYTVSIGASALECPNAFSPNGDGVNDIWKVSYRSIIDFHCEIFNRNGQKIYGFDDPSDGWDGTWHGKTVKPGVYYYVIIATGADGKQYKKSGDINILHTIYYGKDNGSSEE